MPIADMVKAAVAYEMATNPDQFKTPTPAAVDLGLGEGREMTPLSPRMAAWLGGLADAASTYHFLRQGTGTEGNALMRGVQSPNKALVGALGGFAATQGLLAALRHIKRPVADAVEANLGALQLGYAANNMNSRSAAPSSALYHGALMRNLTGER